MRKIIGKLVLPILEWCEKKIIHFYDIEYISEEEKSILSARMVVQLQKEIIRRELPPSFDSFETEDLISIFKALQIMDRRFVKKSTQTEVNQNWKPGDPTAVEVK